MANKLRKVELDKQNPVISETFCGTDAGFYISKALMQASSLECLTLIENIKFKTAVQQMNAEKLVQNAGCDFKAVGTLALTERSLAPKNLMINFQWCKLNLLESWEALQMRPGAWNNGDVPSFSEYVISLMAKNIAQEIEIAIWNGATLTDGSFQGFTTAATGTFATDGTIVPATLTAPFTAANIIANIETTIAAIPVAVLGSEDLRLFMNQKSYRDYISAISKLGYLNAYNMQSDYVPVVNGIKVCVVNGMLDDQIVAAEMSNLFFGTDLISDTTEIRILDMSDLDGSNNVRMVAKYTGGVQHGVGADIVWGK
tara:strand:- start:4545 stop:5486 length:942 start_codon:yes stop_codon:yes gene_type:complete